MVPEGAFAAHVAAALADDLTELRGGKGLACSTALPKSDVLPLHPAYGSPSLAESASRMAGVRSRERRIAKPQVRRGAPTAVVLAEFYRRKQSFVACTLAHPTQQE